MLGLRTTTSAFFMQVAQLGSNKSGTCLMQYAFAGTTMFHNLINFFFHHVSLIIDLH